MFIRLFSVYLSDDKRISTRRLFCLLAIVLFSAMFAKAETIFIANLDGAQASPTTNSNGTGFAVIRLNDDETEISYRLKFSNLGSNSAFAFIKSNSPGQDGGIEFGISWGNINPATSNSSTMDTKKATPDLVRMLKSGRMFFVIPSVNFPNGEIAGRVTPYSPFVARMSGAQAVPVTNSTGKGFATISLNRAENLMLVGFHYSGLNQLAPLGASIFLGMSGTNGNEQFQLSADKDGFHAFDQKFFDITPTQAAQIKAGQFYIRVRDFDDTPNDVIRGQFKPLNKYADFDGDNRADISVFRNSDGTWYRLNSSDNKFSATQWGIAFDDRLVPADYDGDGLTDIAVWRQSSGVFYVLQSSTGTPKIQQWGINSLVDKPRPADYDGDGKADLAVYRKGATSSEQSVYWILNSSDSSVKIIPWGLGSDVSTTGDFDGDRIEDLTVIRNQGGQFVYYTLLSSNGALKAQAWGNVSQHYALTGDFDGDAKADPVAFTFPTQIAGTWWVLGSSSGMDVFQWGNNNDDSFIPADYDGDGKTDAAVFRSDGWYIRRSSNNSLLFVPFGLSNDVPITRFPF